MINENWNIKRSIILIFISVDITRTELSIKNGFLDILFSFILLDKMKKEKKERSVG